MYAALIEIIVPIVTKLSSLVFDMVKNWNKEDYKPIVPGDLEKAIERLKNLKDLPEK